MGDLFVFLNPIDRSIVGHTPASGRVVTVLGRKVFA